MMKTKLMLLFIAIFLIGCSSNRKISEFKSHKLVVVEEVKEVSTDSTKKSKKDSSRTATKMKEDWEESIKEITVYDTSGRKAYTVIETNRKGSRDINKEETKGSESDSVNVKSTELQKVIDSMVTSIDERNEAIPEKKRNTIWNWIGGALFICILLFLYGRLFKI